MRKWMAMLLVAIVLLCCVGCGETADTQTTTTVTTTTTTEAVIGVTTTVATEGTTTAPTTVATTIGNTPTTVCKHESVSKATCTAAGICAACGAEVKPITAHRYYKGKCLLCDVADPNYSAGPVVQKVTLNKESVTLMTGETLLLKSEISPAAAVDKTITWTSSNTAVATVSAGGEVTAEAVGEATITASSANGKTATCKIIVQDVVVDWADLPQMLLYKADYSKKVAIEFTVNELSYTYDSATRKLTISFVGEISYAGNGSPTPTTPNFAWKLTAGNGSVVAEDTWKAETAEGVGTLYKRVLAEIENVDSNRYTLDLYGTFK